MGSMTETELLLQEKQIELKEIGYKLDKIEQGLCKFKKKNYHDLINLYYYTSREIDALREKLAEEEIDEEAAENRLYMMHDFPYEY